MTRVPDPARTRVVLIGTGHYKQAGSLPELPAVRANLLDLRAVFTDAVAGIVPPEHCVVVGDPEVPAHIGTVVTREAAEATDLLLIYYSGHGLVDERGRLHLALSTTDPERLRWTALPFEVLRDEIAASPAAVRVLVLDCCFSGRAFEAMSSDGGVIAGQIDIAGTCTLASSAANSPSYAPVGARHTAFTEALLAALRNPQPLTLDEIFGHVHRYLVSRGLPRPQRRTVNTGGSITLVGGPHSESSGGRSGQPWPALPIAPPYSGSAPPVVPTGLPDALPAGRRILELTLACLLTLMVCTEVQLPFPNGAGPDHLPMGSMFFSFYGLYTLPFGLLTLPSIAFGGNFRHSHVLAAGLVIFNLAALMCATTSSAGMFCAARSAQGLGAALICPYAVLPILHAVPAARRRMAAGLWAVLAAAATVYGGWNYFLIAFAYEGGISQVLLVNGSIGVLALWVVPSLFPSSIRIDKSSGRESALAPAGIVALAAGAALAATASDPYNSTLYWLSLYLLAGGLVLLTLTVIRRLIALTSASARSH